jgi:hypothetical protein
VTTIATLYQVKEQTLTTVADPTTVTLSQGMSWDGQLYAAVTWDGQTVVLDVTQILTRAPNLNGSQTLDAYLAATLTDQFVSVYKTQKLPAADTFGQFQNRLVLIDPMGHPCYTVAVGDMAGNIADPTRITSYDDLIITGPDTLTFNNSFVLINGVMHTSVANGNTLYVKDGYRNIRTKGVANIALGDTTKIGGHSVIPLEQSMMEASPADPWLGVSLNLGQVDISNSTLLLVIDGYLHLLDGSYMPLSSNRVRVAIPQLDLIKNFIHNPNVTFNPPPRTGAESVNPYVADPVIPSATPAPFFKPGDPDYAHEIGQFLLNDYPSLTQNIDTLGIMAPMILMDVGSPTTLLSQKIALFLSNVYNTIDAAMNSVVFVEPGPPPGHTTVLQTFLTDIYPTLSDPSTMSPAVLMYLPPMSDDPAYVLQDLIQNIYPYVDVERTSRDVALISIGFADQPDAGLTNAMNQFFDQYFPDLDVPAADNSNPNVAFSDLETLKSYRISLQGKKGLDMGIATSRSFLYDRLFSPASFFIVIPNTNLYIQRYRLHATETGHRFSWMGPDTPRGLLKYDERFFLPYTVLTAQDFESTLHIGLPSDTVDLIQTAINPVLWPAPHYDLMDKRKARSAELLELYTA